METPGTSNSPSMVGLAGLVRSITHRGSIVSKVTRYALSPTKRALQIRSLGAMSPICPS